jgi:hypothetical protein
MSQTVLSYDAASPLAPYAKLQMSVGFLSQECLFEGCHSVR